MEMLCTPHQTYENTEISTPGRSLWSSESIYSANMMSDLKNSIIEPTIQRYYSGYM